MGQRQWMPYHPMWSTDMTELSVDDWQLKKDSVMMQCQRLVHSVPSDTVGQYYSGIGLSSCWVCIWMWHYDGGALSCVILQMTSCLHFVRFLIVCNNLNARRVLGFLDFFCSSHASCGPRAILLISSLPYILLYLVFLTFPCSLSYSLHLFSCFSIPSHSTRIVPLRFQARCRRRRLNLALVFNRQHCAQRKVPVI